MKSLPIILVVLAVATAIPAWFLPEPEYQMPELIDNRYLGIDIGDASEVSALADQVGAISVIEWVDGGPRTIQIEPTDGEWKIVTKNNYPADGEHRIGQTAGAVLGVEKLRLITAEDIRHSELGVRDPGDLQSAGDLGRGVRVTLTDIDGGSLVDVVVGEAVPDFPGQRYVREMGSDEVFAAEIDFTALSSSFVDWVEPNPLEVEQAAARRLFVRNYSVDFSKGTYTMDSETQLQRADAAADWTSQTVPPNQVVDQDAADLITRTLANLRLADVIKRVGLGTMELQQYGVMVQQNGQVIADEGEVHLTDADGFVYSVFFGEVTGAQAGDEEGASDRAIVVAVAYQPDLDLNKPSGQPDQQADPADEAAIAEAKAALSSHLTERRARAERLNRKYSEFFYVIRDADFQNLRPQGTSLFTDAPEDEDDADSGAALPQAPGPGQMPNFGAPPVP